ncbi:unnamed protein product [Rotaria magnacalcarata]|uniref:Uncharacterized protein n=2 Tax=Rotaria magnacalcarata TaxID=392030 RepID=A0A816VIJ2_9BILA|nr:unnamed protein product [Rotaria magnacalcarata]
MNTSISITLPMIATTTTIQFSVGHKQNNGCNFPCVHCDQRNLLQTNDMKKEKIKIKKDVSDVKDEVIDITDEVMGVKNKMIDITDEVIDITDEVMGVKNKVIDITDEFDFDFEMDKNILHKDPNLYTNFFHRFQMQHLKVKKTTNHLIPKIKTKVMMLFLQNALLIFRKSFSI